MVFSLEYISKNDDNSNIYLLSLYSNSLQISGKFKTVSSNILSTTTSWSSLL